MTNKIYIPNYYGNDVYVINGLDNSTTRVVSGGLNPKAIAVNPITNKIYVANFTTNNVTVINGADNTTQTVAAGTNPKAIAVNPVTNKIYVANSGSNNVTVINGTDNSTQTVAARSAPTVIAVNPVTNKIYADGGVITVINGADNSTATAFRLGDAPTGIAVNPATNKIYVTSTYTISVINGDDNSTTNLRNPNYNIVPGEGMYQGVAVNPITNKVYFADGGGSVSITVLTEQNTQRIPLTVAITKTNAQYSNSPSFTFTVSNSFSPTPPPVQQVHYQVDTLINPWLTATQSGNNTWSATVGPLQDGIHILYAYATEGEDATSTNTGSGNGTSSSPLIGQIQSKVFLVNGTGIGPITMPSSISGQVMTTDGTPLAGVLLRLSGASSKRTITDSSGHYRFDSVDADGFYIVTPEFANYTFSPSQLAFSLSADKTDAVFTATAQTETANPLDTAEFFVRQHYVDFLSREPDEGGFNYWSNEILKCGRDAACINSRRLDVSAAFFIEQEFQQTGSYIFRLYRAGLGRDVSYAEFNRDHQQVLGGVNLNANLRAFADAFVQRAEFVQKYQNATTADSFVDAVIQTVRQATGVDLSSQRSVLISQYDSTHQTQSRSFVMQTVVNNNDVKQSSYNPSFVLMQYFGYLKRDPDAGGYQFWLDVLNNKEPNNYRGMVCSFITSAEYQRRFATVVTHSNSECPAIAQP